MRRARYLLAVAVVGAASAASAQGRAIALARLVPQASGPPWVAVHVSNLLDDPQWLEPWRNAYVVQVHWKVQLWQKNFLINTSQPAVEWDVYVQQVPTIDLFNYTERTTGRTMRKSFGTVDSLKAYLTEDVSIPGPRQLAPGRWYYRIDVRVATSAEDPLDPRTAANAGGVAQAIVGWIVGGGPTRDLPTVTVPFTVP